MASNRDILNSIDPVVLAARAALERNARMLGDADRRIARMERDDEARRVGRISPTRLHRPLPGEEVNYEAPGVLMDPDSWLNRGLSNLAGNAASVILGEESGNPAVDYGLSNIPGVGAAGILAAGGVPGMVDVAGAGALKNAAKIPKYTMEFVLKHFGERGLRNLDNALTKYPKAGKPTVGDAIQVMKSGIGGERVPATLPYSVDVEQELAKSHNWSMDEYLDNIQRGIREISKIAENDPQVKAALPKVIDVYNQAVRDRDLTMGITASTALYHVGGPLSEKGRMNLLYTADPKMRKVVSQRGINGLYQSFIQSSKNATPGTYSFDLDAIRELKEVYESPVQDWGAIVKKQEAQDARDAEKLAKKAAKQAATPQQAAVAKQAEIEAAETKAAIQETPAQEIVPAPETVPEPVEKWVGWNEGNPKFYENFGENLDRNSRRDAFVMDSLANHWANQLNPQKGFSAARILSGLDRADARHSLTNYDQVSRGFANDVLKNLESGNMPGQSVQMLQRFKRNRAVPGHTTPTMVLRLDEKPKVFLNPNVWADEAEGPDLYELLFRPRIDRKLHEANPAYWER